MQLTRYELGEDAQFLDGEGGFRLKANPFPGVGDIPLGLYELPRRSGEAHLYRLGHPLAMEVLRRARDRTLPRAEICFDYSGTLPMIAGLRPFMGQAGELLVSLFTIESLDQVEDYLLVVAVTDDGQMIAEESARRMFSLPAISVEELAPALPNSRLTDDIARRQATIRQTISERNARLFGAEADKLDHWADDLKVALEREIKDFDRQIKEAKRASTVALTLEEKLAGQKQIRAIEGQRNAKRRALFEAQDEIDQRRERLIADIEAKLTQRAASAVILSLRWRLA
jgi:adenine-specific DNA-methyltransferase